jgi:hypothetical protein
MCVYSRFARAFGIAADRRAVARGDDWRVRDRLARRRFAGAWFRLADSGQHQRQQLLRTERRPGQQRFFSEVGVNASWRLTPGLQLSASCSRIGPAAPTMAACGSITAWSTGLHCRARRGVAASVWDASRPAYGLYNTTRDVPFTRPSIILPQSIYFERTRNSDRFCRRCGDLPRALRRGGYALRQLRAYGQPQTDTEPATVALVGLNRPGHLDRSWLPILQVMYEGAGRQVSAGFTALHLDLRYKPGSPTAWCRPLQTDAADLLCPVQRRELEPDQ